MKIIICIEKDNGLMFNNRRVSSDSVVIDRIIKMLGDGKLFLNEYSARLFLGKTDMLNIDEDFLNKAENDDYCFVENTDILNHLHECNQFIVYQWNRKYPSDFKFPREEALKNRKSVSVIDFVGNSHEKITEEIWE